MSSGTESSTGRNGVPDRVGTVEVRGEQVGPPARALLRLTETRPDGRRLTRYTHIGVVRGGEVGGR